MKTQDTRYTGITGIKICNSMPGRWQHIDTNDGAERAVGMTYQSKAMLMVDHTDYLLRAGWLKLAIKLPEPQLETSVKLGCYGWSMEDIEVNIKVYGESKTEAVAIFEKAIEDEFGGRVTIEPQVQPSLV